MPHQRDILVLSVSYTGHITPPAIAKSTKEKCNLHPSWKNIVQVERIFCKLKEYFASWENILQVERIFYKLRKYFTNWENVLQVERISTFCCRFLLQFNLNRVLTQSSWMLIELYLEKIWKNLEENEWMEIDWMGSI